MTSTTSRQFTYPESIVETSRRNGWDVRRESNAIVVTDGCSTVWHRLGGEAEAAYEARLDYEDVHRAEVAAYAAQKRRDEALRAHTEWLRLRDEDATS